MSGLLRVPAQAGIVLAPALRVLALVVLGVLGVLVGLAVAPGGRRGQPLAIAYATYLGGAGTEDLREHETLGLAVDREGSAYVVGTTASPDFPLHDPWQHGCDGAFNLYIAKLDRGGRLVYSTYLGGSHQDFGYAIAVDAQGNAYVTGESRSEDFPGASPAEGGAFVVKLDRQGFVVYSRFVARGHGTAGRAVAIDSRGRIHVAGTLGRRGRLETEAAAAAGAGGVFVAVVEPDGTIGRASRLSGDGYEHVGGLAIDAHGGVFIAGTKTMPAEGGFVIKLDASGAVVYDVPLRGSASAIALDAVGRAYVAGSVGEGPAAQAFVAKLDSSGAPLYWKPFGGSGVDRARGLSVDRAGRAHVAGLTHSTDFPRYPAASAPGGGTDAFVAVLSADGADLVHAGVIGGRGRDAALAAALDPSDALYVAGVTRSADLPVSPRPHAVQPDYAGEGDAFVVRARPLPLTD